MTLRKELWEIQVAVIITFISLEQLQQTFIFTKFTHNIFKSIFHIPPSDLVFKIRIVLVLGHAFWTTAASQLASTCESYMQYHIFSICVCVYIYLVMLNCLSYNDSYNCYITPNTTANSLVILHPKCAYSNCPFSSCVKLYFTLAGDSFDIDKLHWCCQAVCGGDDWQVLMRAAVWQCQVLMEMRPSFTFSKVMSFFLNNAVNCWW